MSSQIHFVIFSLKATLFRTINTKTSGSSIVERFQEEITDKVAVIVKQYLNKFVLLAKLSGLQNDVSGPFQRWTPDSFSELVTKFI